MLLSALALFSLMVPNMQDAKSFSKDPLSFWVNNKCDPFLVLQPATEKDIIVATICKNVVGIMHGYGDKKQKAKTLFLLNKTKVQIEQMLISIIKDNERVSNPVGKWINHITLKSSDSKADIWVWARLK